MLAFDVTMDTTIRRRLANVHHVQQGCTTTHAKNTTLQMPVLVMHVNQVHFNHWRAWLDRTVVYNANWGRTPNMRRVPNALHVVRVIIRTFWVATATPIVLHVIQGHTVLLR